MHAVRHEITAVLTRFLTDHGVPETKIPSGELFKRPEQEAFGDLALPCFPFARYLKTAPPAIAAALQPLVSQVPGVLKAEVVGAYLNIHLDKLAVLRRRIDRLDADPTGFFHRDLLQGETVVVEFSSPNIAKPFSIGHLRTTVIGNFLQNLFRAMGANVVAINHIGDWGTQFGKLIVAYRRWGNEAELDRAPVRHLLSLYVRFHSEAEADPALEDAGREAFRQLESGAPEETALWERFRELSLREFNRTYDRLNVHFDHVLGEAFYRDRLDDVTRLLKGKGLLKESRNAMIVDLEPWDMPPCLIQKSDGASLYATRDIAAAIYRQERFRFDRSLYVVGAEQTLHFRQFFQVLALAGFDWADRMEHIPFGLYRFKDGKMSTRKGKVVFLEEVLDEAVQRIRSIMEEKNPDMTSAERDEVAEMLGTSAIIFNDLKNDRVKDVAFDWDEVLNMDGDSGPYISYSYVRCRGILDRVGEVSNSLPPDAALTAPEEEALVRKLAQFDDILALCVRHRKSHFLAQYMLELTRTFHSFYHHCRVAGTEPAVAATRKAMVRLTAATLRAGADLMGMRLPEKM